MQRCQWWRTEDPSGPTVQTALAPSLSETATQKHTAGPRTPTNHVNQY